MWNLPRHSRCGKSALAATLLAGSVKLDDLVLDGDVPAGRIGRRCVGTAGQRTRPRAKTAAGVAGVDASLIFDAVSASTSAEQRSSRVLADWLEPPARATAELFRAASPAVGTELATIGARVGTATLLADAVGDLDRDRERGRPNPILAGACSKDEAIDRVDQDARLVARRVRELTGEGLAAALWGPAWMAGLHRSAGRSMTCKASASYTPEWGPEPRHDVGAGHSRPTSGGLWDRTKRRVGNLCDRFHCCECCDCCDCCCDCCCTCDSCECCGCDC